MGKDLGWGDLRLLTQGFHFLPYIITAHGAAAFGNEDGAAYDPACADVAGQLFAQGGYDEYPSVLALAVDHRFAPGQGFDSDVW